TAPAAGQPQPWCSEYGFRSIDFGGPSPVYGINDAGQVLGWGMIWDPVNGSRSLGSLGGTTRPRCVNEAGQVAGWSYTPSRDAHAFFWDEVTGMQDIGTLGGASSWATAMNDIGQVVGYSETATGTQHAFIWDEAGGIQDLGTILAHSQAVGINNASQVIGFSYNEYDDIYYRLTRPFVWDLVNGLQPLNPEGQPLHGGVNWINESGIIAGWTEWSAYANFIACRFDAANPSGSPQALWYAILPYCNSEAMFIHDDGRTVGWARPKSPCLDDGPFGPHDAYYWAAGNFVGNPIGGGNGRNAYEIIASGEILMGWENIEDTHGALAMRSYGPTFDLRDLIANGAAYHTLEPDGMNAHGEIAGTAINADITGRYPYIMWPCPGDVDGDRTVGVSDFLEMLAAWGPCDPPPATCPADTNKDGMVDVVDFLRILAAWD
ncbi:MAG: hypothetical protein ACYSU7_15350, partial [Planctomycetota bacterium]